MKNDRFLCIYTEDRHEELRYDGRGSSGIWSDAMISFMPLVGKENR